MKKEKQKRTKAIRAGEQVQNQLQNQLQRVRANKEKTDLAVAREKQHLIEKEKAMVEKAQAMSQKESAMKTKQRALTQKEKQFRSMQRALAELEDQRGAALASGVAIFLAAPHGFLGKLFTTLQFQ